ncbi:MAG: formamidopyrimidine-DNA glycosylase, partial [Chloroflexi bacterium]
RALVFNDTRKFGRIWLVDDPDQVIGRLGPEPFDPAFTAQTLYEALRQRRRQVKPLLLDQSFLAGLGNIYTDEALHLSGVHPQRVSDTISVDEAERLFRAVRTVLQLGIEHNGASIDWVYRGGNFQNHFRVYDRAGQPCPVCGTPIQRMTVSQRGTHFCPTCQVK